MQWSSSIRAAGMRVARGRSGRSLNLARAPGELVCGDWPCGQNPGRKPAISRRAKPTVRETKELRRTGFDLQGQHCQGPGSSAYRGTILTTRFNARVRWRLARVPMHAGGGHEAWARGGVGRFATFRLRVPMRDSEGRQRCRSLVQMLAVLRSLCTRLSVVLGCPSARPTDSQGSLGLGQFSALTRP